jgi:myosin heavy subunit
MPLDSVWIPSGVTQARYNIPGELMYGNGRAVWLPATLSQPAEDGSSTYSLDWDASVKVKANDSDVLPRGLSDNTSPDDLVQLECPNEGSIMYALGERFRKTQLVMKLSRNFVYLNPVNRLLREQGSHKNSMADMYNDGSSDELSMYSIAEEAHRVVSESLTNQTVILRGCSGSGKTELSKHIIQYLLFVEAPRRDPATTENATYVSLGHAANPLLYDSTHVARGTAASTLIMDAFGSAPTEKSPSSSRLVRNTKFQYNMSKWVHHVCNCCHNIIYISQKES